MNKIKELVKRYNEWWFDNDLCFCHMFPIVLSLLWIFLFLGLFVRVFNTSGFVSLGILFLALLVVMECFYWADEEKKELNSFWGGIKYTMYKKIDALNLALSLFCGYAWVILSPINLVLGYHYNRDTTTAFLIVFGILGIILGVMIVYLWLNSLKYRKREGKQ